MLFLNKMKCMLLVAAALFTVNGAFAESKSFLVAYGNMTLEQMEGTEVNNQLTGNAGDTAEGIVLQLTGNTAKAYSKGNEVSLPWNGETVQHTAIRLSNGAQNTLTMPEGWVATKATFYSYVNLKEERFDFTRYPELGYRTPYWKEVAGTSYTEADATIMKVFVEGDLTNPDVISFDLDKVSSFTFTNRGEQVGFVMKIDAEAVSVIDSLKVDGMNILEVGKTYLFGEQYSMYKVQFTAEKDGFLTIAPSQKVAQTGFKINDTSLPSTRYNQIYINGVKSGGIDKKGMAAGSVFTGTFYCTGIPSDDNVYSLTVTFEEGVPYSPLALTLASPADGDEWSGAAQYKNYGTKGAAHYEFSSIISADVVASVKIGEKVYSPIKCNVDSYNPKLDIVALPDTLSKAIAAGLIKAGETFTLTLSNIVDKEFAANTLADQTFTYTLASTACTGVSPTPSTSRTVPLTDVTFAFDGKVALADTAKFYMVNLANNDTTALAGEVVEGTSVVITVPTIEGLLPRKYNIVAEGVTTAEGDRVITYGNEPGKLVASYGTSNGFFKAVTSLQNWSQVYSLEGFTATYPGEVIKVDGIAKDPISFVKVDPNTGEEEEMADVTLNYTISEENPNVIEFALSKPITEVGTYRLSVPQKHFWAKDTYAEEDAKLSVPKFAYYQAFITLTIDVVEPTATDVTDKLVNPNFDDANANTGWNAGSKKLQFANSVEPQQLKDGTIFVGNIVERWESAPWDGDIAQNVKELPAGAYKFTMGTYVNKAGEAYIFANDSLSLPIEATKVSEYAVFVELAEGTDLKVGVKNVSGINWIVMDNAHLYYYGEGTTVDMAIKADWNALLDSVATLKATYADPIEVEALDAAVAAAKMGTIQEYLASVKAVNEAMAAFKKVNDAEVAWKTLAAALKDATADAPVDATGFIANPSFENGQTWLKNGTGGGAINQPNEWKLSMEQEGWGDVCMNQTVPQDGAYIFNVWSGTIHSVDLNQAVRLPGGSYTMTAAMRTEWTHHVTDQHIYAVIGTDTIHSDTLQVISIMRPTGDNATNANEWKTVEGWQNLTAKFSLNAETIVTIGVLSTGGTNDNAGYFQIDNFRLSCTGWVDPIIQPAIDSLNTLIVEVEEFQKTLDLADAMQASMSEALTQNITVARAAVEAQESVTVVRGAYNELNMMYVQIVANLAGMEAQTTQTMMAEYENPTDKAGLANAINKVNEIVSYLLTGMGETAYTVADLNAAVEAMRTAKDVFVKENSPTTEVVVTLVHTASSYCETNQNVYTSTVDAEKEHLNNSKFSGTWQGAAYAEFSVLLPEGISIKSATLAWAGIGSSKKRTTDIMYVNAGETLDYETMRLTGTEKVNLPATTIGTVTFPANVTTDFTTDVTEAVKTIIGSGQNYVIFKFTNNIGTGDIVGKGAAEKAPVLTLETASIVEDEDVDLIGTEFEDEEASVVWTFTDSITETPSITPKGVFSRIEVSAGSMTLGTSSAKGVDYITVCPEDATNTTVTWSVTPINGLIFTPTKVYAKIQRFGTISGLIDVVVRTDEEADTLATDLIPLRNNSTMEDDQHAGNEKLCDEFLLDVPASLATKKTFTLAAVVKNLSSTKYVGFSDVRIYGTVNGVVAEEINVDILVSLVNEVVAWKNELNGNDEMHATVIVTLEQMILEAQVVIDNPESAEQVRQMIADVTSALGTYRPMIAKYDASIAATIAADEAQAFYDAYANPMDNTDLVALIQSVREGIELLNDTWESISIEELALRVEAMKVALDTFIKENAQFAPLIEDLKLKIEEVEAWRSSLSETDTIRMMVISDAENLIQTAEALMAGQLTVEELEEKIQEFVSFMDSYPEMLDTYDAALEAIRIAEELMAAHPEINSTSLVSYMSRLERELKAYGLNRVSRVQSYTRSLNSRIESFRNSLNYFTIPNVEARLYEPFTLPVSMTNDEEITAFQCDIYLHGDLEMNLNAEGDYDIKLSADRATSSHTVASELQADGAIRVIVYSNGSKLFKGNSGELFTIGLTALSAESPVDTVTGFSVGVSVQNIRLSTSDEREILIASVGANVTVKTYTPADVNGDGAVSIVDVVAVVNNILGRNAGNFVFEAADMDQNGEITIVDVVAVVNVLLGKDVQALGARSLLLSDIHVADAEVNADGTATFYVKLDNAQAYTAMQMDVDLPEGLSIEGVEMVGCPAHAVVFNEEGRIAAYSLNNSRFGGGESLMAITVKADESFAGNALVGFTNVRVVSANVQEAVLADVLANISGGGATGIDGILADEEVQILYYSTTGAVSDKPHKGLNVVKRICEDGRVEVSKEVCE